MIVYFTDGTENGFLTAVFDAYYTEKKADIITSDKTFQPAFDTETITIETDGAKAERVKKAVIKYGKNQTYNDICDVLRSGSSTRETVAYEYTKLLMAKKEPLFGMFAEIAVINFNDLLMKVRREAHRFKGFLRFIETSNGNFYAHYEPDNDVTALIMPHFSERYKNMRFVIHDTKRGIFGLYNGLEYVVLKNETPVALSLSESETQLENLWKQYYQSVNIKERKNLRCQANYLPRRYRKNMTEFKSRSEPSGNER